MAFIDPSTDATLDQPEIEVQASIREQGGGIGKVIWKVNGTTVAASFHAEGSPDATDQSSKRSERITLQQPLTLLPGENYITLIAYNKFNEIA